MRDDPRPNAPADTTLTLERALLSVTSSNMRFGMPATWDDMLVLGLDPITGEVT